MQGMDLVRTADGLNRTMPDEQASPGHDLQFVEQLTLEHIILGDDLSTSMQDSTCTSTG